MRPQDIIVGIDDGHGIYDETGTRENPGKRTPIFPDGHYILEDIFNRGAVKKFVEACRRQGFTALELVPEDINVDLSERVRRANAWGCNFVVSWHFNAFRGVWDETKGGISVHYQDGYYDSQRLAGCVLKYLVQGTQQNNRGVVADDLQICRETKGTAILIESGFMDVMAEAKIMDQEWYWTEQAEQACMGLCEYLGFNYIPERREEIMKLIIHNGDPDKRAAEYMSDLTGIAVKHIDNLTEEEKKTATGYAIGGFLDNTGQQKPIPLGFEIIRGSDRYDTVIQAIKKGGYPIKA